MDFVGLKNKNSQAKFLLAIGGAYDSGVPSTTNKYSKLASSSTNTNLFTQSVVNFLKQYKFDGLSLDWFYPTVSDKTNYGNLIVALKTALGKAGLLLSATVSGKPTDIDAGILITSVYETCFSFR